MISFRMLSLPMFALVAALAGCSAEQGTTVQPDTASTAQQAAQTDGEGKGHGPRGPHGPPGGPELLIGASLHAPIDLTDAQRTTIEGLLKDGRPEHRPPPAFDATKAKTLADAVRAGNVASLPKPPGPDQAMIQAHMAESAARIKTLHDTLTADQRAKLVADLESHGGHGERGPGAHGKGAPPPRGDKAERPKGGERAAFHHGPHGPHGGPGGEFPFGQDLHLTDAQKEQLKAKFEASHAGQAKPDFEAMKTEMKSKLESFKADNFDATAFVTPKVAFQPKGDINPLADLVSVLTPEQRETLAKKIEAGPPAAPQK